MRDGGRAGAFSAVIDAEDVKACLRRHPEIVRGDPALLAELGLRPHGANGANVIDFGPAALSRLTAARRREAGQRRHLEAVARANHAAQIHTRAGVVELVACRGLGDIAACLDGLARQRLGLAAGVVALEGPGAIPAGWTTLAKGQVDLVLGPRRGVRLGHAPTALGLFPRNAGAIGSVAVMRLGLWKPRRKGLLAFGSAEPRAFAADMGVELLDFLARIVERTAERWPAP